MLSFRSVTPCRLLITSTVANYSLRLLITSTVANYSLFRTQRALEALGDRLERPCYLSRVDHDRKIEQKAKDRYRKIFLCK
jgi:hypothetical protein